MGQERQEERVACCPWCVYEPCRAPLRWWQPSAYRQALHRSPRQGPRSQGRSHCCPPHWSSYRWQGHGRHRREGQGEEVSGLQVAAQVVLAVRVIVLLSFGRSARKLLAHVGAAARGGFGASRPASFFFLGGVFFFPKKKIWPERKKKKKKKKS